MKKRQVHEFALYVKQLPAESKELTITDKGMVHRITHVLRLGVAESVILFNQQHHIRFTLTKSSKNQVTGTTDALQNNTFYKPAVTLILPVLKKDALEAAVYGAVECGVTTIQLVTTQKVQRKWGAAKECERLERIVIAAAEQSKCFAFANIVGPVSLQDALQKCEGTQLLFADPAGKSLQKITQDCAVLVGPEGDLTESEKELVKTAGAEFFKLTPTVLRAQQAAVLSVGVLRTLF
jgi:16S rRNA (uracil1498-N3)-methyltransferase